MPVIMYLLANQSLILMDSADSPTRDPQPNWNSKSRRQADAPYVLP
jgi:hypothetical protein